MEGFKEFYHKYLKNWICLSIVLSFFLNLIIEICARHSLIEGLRFLASEPLVFLYNVFLIFVTLIPALLFRRRIFASSIVSGIWLTIGIVNGVITSNRMTPFTTKDLAILKEGVTIITNYLSKGEMILAAVAIVVVITALVIMFRRAPKKDNVAYKKNIAVILLIYIVFASVTFAGIHTKVLDTYFGNLAYAYRDNGVPYCFINTWLNTGISKPRGYSEERVCSIFTEKELEDIRKYAESEKERANADNGIVAMPSRKTPNIIFLQLESFIDPAFVKNIRLSGDAVPFWNELKKKYSTGWYTVPSVGAGTANTEFETMTGMSVKFFGPGEYPHKSILGEQTCESYPYVLDSMGYRSHAIHNHRGVFYNRNKVYPNLGYDTFTSLEYMSNVIKTPGNWAKDSILTGEITAALDSTKGADYIFAISVQGHGKYPSEPVLENPEIRVTEAPTEERRWQYEYYSNLMKEMDDFVKDLVTSLEERDEETVLIMYGDHLPALDMKAEELRSGDIYKTEYIIYSNFDMEKIDEDMYSYQIGAEVLDRLGIHEGTMTKFHQEHKDSPTYRDDLKLLEYDMLYGKRYIYGGFDPFTEKNMKMGIRDIKITGIVQIGEKFYIKGENFTEQSRISLDGEVLDTIYLGPTVLGLLEKVDEEDVSRMKVSQVDRNSGKDILSTTE